MGQQQENKIIMKKLCMTMMLLAGASALAQNEQAPTPDKGTDIWKGTKTWYWSPTNINGGAVWGNGGYIAGPDTGNGEINGAWWGCGFDDGSCGDTFASMADQAGNNYGKYVGECYASSLMKMNAEDGTISSYDNYGNLVISGDFNITNYKDNEITDPNNYSRGTLTTTPGTILWPFAINTAGFMPERFDISYLSDSEMILRYAVEGAGAWSECTWWSFSTKKPDTSSVDRINAGSAKEGYYTLDGVKVAKPVKGNVYIKVKNGKSTRVRIK